MSVRLRPVAVLVVLMLTASARGNIFQVYNTNEYGPGSLRQAILDANAAEPAPHTILIDSRLAGATIYSQYQVGSRTVGLSA
ncbi:MAG TPA: hypothetical protein VLV78_08090 [Thermoanaerobaculia bacterium]|nr:hypothetical protein [Thermoanaerobaculia bacterium]